MLPLNFTLKPFGRWVIIMDSIFACFSAGWVSRSCFDAAPPAPVPTHTVATSDPAPNRDTDDKTTPFRWGRIESKDYAPFVRNLRGIGCPEDVIRDIIATEAWCDFHGLPTGGAGPWNDLLASLPDRAKARNLALFVNEILGTQTLAVDEPTAGQNFAPLTSNVPSVSDVAVKAEATFVAGMNAVWARIGERQPSAAELDEIFRIQDARDGSLARVMTEPERERYEAERAGILPQLRSELAELNLSDEEALTLLRLRGYEADSRTSGAPPDDPNELELAKSRTQALRELLGDARYDAYQRLQDFNYVMLSDLGKRQGLSSETVVKAYQLVSSDTDVSPDGIPFDTRLKSVLGEDAFNDWVELGEVSQSALAHIETPPDSGEVNASADVTSGPR